MVAINIKNKQSDTNLPLYIITCLDDLFDPNAVTDIQAKHFKSDSYAVGWSKDYAHQQCWYSWGVYRAADNVEIFFVNCNTGEQRVYGEDVPKR